MRIRRDISAVPLRTASETWTEIVSMVSDSGSVDVAQLSAAVGVMGSVIADENAKDRPMILEGVGPQLRIYLQYGEDAVTAGTDVDSLSWNPTAGDWTMHVPCDAANLEWVRKSLQRTSPRMKVYDLSGDFWREDEAGPEKQATDLKINWNVRG